MGSRGAFIDVNKNEFTFVDGGQHYNSIGCLSSNPNVKVLVQDSNNVKAPEYSHTANRIYAVVKNGELKHLSYYDESHKQSVSIDLSHEHKGVKPHRHVYLCHDKNAPRSTAHSRRNRINKKDKKGVSFAMRKNEFNSLEDFTSQYTGVWAPSEGQWFGLDFYYNGVEYRFNTGAMYEEKNTILPNGKEAIFGLYRKSKNPTLKKEYVLLEEFADMEDVLNSACIDGIAFRDIITDDETELLGQD